VINKSINGQRGEVFIAVTVTVFIAWLAGTMVGGLTDEIRTRQYDHRLSRIKNEMRVYAELYSRNPSLHPPDNR